MSGLNHICNIFKNISTQSILCDFMAKLSSFFVVAFQLMFVVTQLFESCVRFLAEHSVKNGSDVWRDLLFCCNCAKKKNVGLESGDMSTPAVVIK